MVGHPDGRGAGLDAAAGVVGAQDTLGDDRQPGLLGQPDQVVRPEVERLLGAGRVLVAGVEVDPEQLGVDDVPDDLVAGGVLRPDDRGVHGEHDGLGAGLDRAREQRLGEGPVGREVGLEPPAHTGGGDVGERRPGVAGDDQDGPGGGRRLGHRHLAVRVDRPLLRRRRDAPRHPDGRAEQRHGQVDVGHVTQHVRDEAALGPAPRRLERAHRVARTLGEVLEDRRRQGLARRALEVGQPGHRSPLTTPRRRRSSSCPVAAPGPRRRGSPPAVGT